MITFPALELELVSIAPLLDGELDSRLMIMTRP